MTTTDTTDTTDSLRDGCQDLTEHVTHLRAAYNETVPATAATYTATRSGLAAAAQLVELLRDLPLLGVGVDSLTDEDSPTLRVVAETAADAEAIAMRLGINEVDPYPANRYREWAGVAWLNPGEPIYVALEHDEPAPSAAADRRDRRRSIVAWTRAALGFALMVAGGLAVADASVRAYGPLPGLLFGLGLIVYPDHRPGPGVVRRVAARIRRLIRRGGAR